MHTSRWDSPLWSMGILLPLFISALCVSHGRRWNTGLPDHVVLRCRTYLKSDNIYNDMVCLRTEAFFPYIEHPVLYLGRTELKVGASFLIHKFLLYFEGRPCCWDLSPAVSVHLSDLGHKMNPTLLWMFVWLVNADIYFYFLFLLQVLFVLIRGPQLSHVSQQVHQLSSHLCPWHTDVVFMRVASDF